MSNSNLPQAKQVPIRLTPQSCDYDAFVRLADIKDNIVEFVDSGSTLYLCSSITGNGKTSWAIKLMHKYFDEIWCGNGFNVRALFVHVPTFLLKCKDFGNKDYSFEALKKMLPTVDLVVWDDIASINASAYDFSQLIMYIDARSLNNKSNIFTGNITSRDDLEKALGSKLTSRIWCSSAEIIEFKGGDRR